MTSMRELTVQLHYTGQDGLPNEDAIEYGRVAFLWGAQVITGSPVDPSERGDWWEDGTGQKYLNVTHWLEFPAPLSSLKHGQGQFAEPVVVAGDRDEASKLIQRVRETSPQLSSSDSDLVLRALRVLVAVLDGEMDSAYCEAARK